MDMVFKFRDGSHLKGNAQVVGEALLDIREDRGRLIAGEVVLDATAKDSPLHAYFEWNNTKAAAEYRLTQARHLIASVVIVETKEQGEIDPIRAWCKLNSQEGYEAINVVMRDPALRKEALKEVKRGIDSLREKLVAFEGFADLLGALDEVEQIAKKHEDALQGAPG